MVFPDQACSGVGQGEEEGRSCVQQDPLPGGILFVEQQDQLECEQQGLRGGDQGDGKRGDVPSDGLPFSGGKRDEETDGHEEGRKCEDPPCLQVNRVCLDIAVVQEQQDGATAQAGSGAGGISDDV